MSRLATALVALTLLCVAPAAGQDLAGSWEISASVLLPDQILPCVFEGTGTIEQSNGTLGGTVTLDLVSGPEACPESLQGTLSGTASGGDVKGTITDADLGSLDFSGSVTPPPVAILSPKADEMLEGDLSVSSGPFEGRSGTWMAMLAAPVSTLTPVGLAVLALLLVGVALFALRQRHA